MADYPTYPKRAEDVTADALIRFTVDAGQQFIHINEHYIRRDDPDGRALFHTTTRHIVDNYALAYLLQQLAELNPDWADEVATRIWRAWEDGDTPFEQLWEWCREYGIPTEPDPRRQPSDG